MKHPTPKTKTAFVRALGVASTILLTAASHAAVISHDNFEAYPANTAVNTLNTGTGWTSPWTAITAATISSESITYSLGSSTLGGGNSLKVAAADNNALNRTVATAPTGQARFVSFVFQLKNGTSTAPITATDFAGFQARDANPDHNNDPIGYIGLSGKAGARVDSSDNSFTTSLNYGQTYFFVIKYEGWNGTTYTTSTVWLNPATGDENTTNTAIKRSKTVSTSGSGSSSFTGLIVRTFGLDATAYLLVDDLRIGTAWADVVSPAPLPAAPTVTAAVSRKTHGSAGTFDVPLSVTVGTTTPPAGVAVESRQVGALTVVATFNKQINAVTPSVAAGTATIDSVTYSGSTVTLALSGVTDAQKLALKLDNIRALDGGLLPSATLHLNVLVGDVTGDSIVASDDVDLVRSLAFSNPTLTTTNFRRDLDVSGTITSADLDLVRMLAGGVIPQSIQSPTAPLTIAANNAWSSYNHVMNVAAGGVFDYSYLLDAPAGKHGPIKVVNGRFEFQNRPGVRAKFAGVNLNFSAHLLDPVDADLLATTLARSGYNTVRFHHFDNEIRDTSQATFQFDAAKLAKLDYLFHALKSRGIYINIDLYVSRGFSSSEIASFGLTGSSLSGNVFKALIPIDTAAYENWRRYAQMLLTHVNPHTGLTWGNDPALIGICPVNEDNLYNHYDVNATVAARYESAFNAAVPPVAGETAAQRAAKRYKFLCEMHAASEARIYTYLRSLNIKAILSGTNYGTTQAIIHQRKTYDYVDNHSYFDHPSYPGATGSLPLYSDQDSPTLVRATMPRDVTQTRIFGKPFTVTEWNACRPNEYRAEASVIMPAFASLQDWDGLWCFQYGDTRNLVINGGTTGSFAISSDPIGLINARVTSLLFQRGDISPGVRSIAWAVRDEEAFSADKKTFTNYFLLVGLICKSGSLPGQPAAVSSANPFLSAVVTGASPAPTGLPANGYIATSSLISDLIAGGRLPAGSLTGSPAKTVSDTNQITLDSATGITKVITPRSELFALSPSRQVTGDRASLTNGATPASVCVISLTNDSIATTSRILVTHLTDALPTGMRFSTPARTTLEAWGSSPHLVARGETTLTLTLAAGTWSAWVVDATGARVRPATLIKSGSVHLLQMATISPDGTQLAYELVRSP